MSGPDSGLAAAIGLAMICMLMVPALVGGAIGYVIASRARRDKEKAPAWLRFGTALAGALLGGLGGAAAILFTFFESKFDPVLMLEASAPVPDAVFVLEDPAGAELEWNLWGTEARATVPPSGVVRLRDLGDLSGFAFTAELPDGRHSMGYSSRPSPPGLPGPAVVCVSFAAWEPNRVDDCETRDEALVALIRAREADAAP